MFKIKRYISSIVFSEVFRQLAINYNSQNNSQFAGGPNVRSVFHERKIISSLDPKISMFLYPAWKMSLFGVVQSECGRMRTRITPNTDTFYAVLGLKELASVDTI